MRSEFALIDDFLARFDAAPGRIARVPAGDDCAVLATSGEELCVTTDAVVENVHFTFPAFSFADVGHKALAVNLSDLAAMGARPRWFLCAIAMPRTFGAREVRGIAKGMSALAKEAGIALVGGNFTAASELSITITAAGGCPPHEALTRAGAHAGEALYVSGTLGDARAGVSLLGAAPKGDRKGDRLLFANAKGRLSPFTRVAGKLTARAGRVLQNRQKRPQPRVALGLLARRFASAAIDLSDGLSQDLGHLCDASKVGASVALEQLPLCAPFRAWAGTKERAWSEAAAGGEDYELLLAIPPGKARAFEKAAASLGTPVTRIGQLEPGRQIRLLRPDGTLFPLPPGHDHFRPSARGSTAASGRPPL